MLVSPYKLLTTPGNTIIIIKKYYNTLLIINNYYFTLTYILLENYYFECHLLHDTIFMDTHAPVFVNY